MKEESYIELAFDRVSDRPQTHVLIIGVGNYPYLKSGSQEEAQTVIGLQQLEQLTSPPESALALYRTFIEFEKQGILINPLGSIDLLISAAPGADIPDDLNYRAATIRNVELAFDAWWKRCDRNKDNTAIFFFCGHGLEKGDQYLLTEDFGENPRNPWRGAFAFDTTRSAFHGCAAQTQLFFIDACRQVTGGMLEANLSGIPGLATGSYIGTESIYNLTIKAAAQNRNAYGQEGSASYFTSALIRGLSGHASTSNEDDEWIVETGRLALLMTQLIKLENESQGFPQRCPYVMGESKAIIRLKEVPEVILQVNCNPDAALEHAALSCIEPVSRERRQREPAGSPWEIPLKAGVYELQASFAGRQYTDSRKMTTVIPPFKKERIKCQ